MGVLAHYELTPGDPGSPSEHWPDSSRLVRGLDQMTLVMVAHPQCPCARASIEELARVMALCQGRVEAHVVFVVPDTFDDDWAKTDLWSAAQIIPGVRVLADHSGLEATTFGATTSGYTLLYNAEGKLVFSGGITGSRGHSGDNAGQSRVIALVNGNATETTAGFVFGCSLFGASTN